MEFDTSLPPSRELSPLDHATRPQPSPQPNPSPQPTGGATDDGGGGAQTRVDQGQEQQPQQPEQPQPHQQEGKGAEGANGLPEPDAGADAEAQAAAAGEEVDSTDRLEGVPGDGDGGDGEEAAEQEAPPALRPEPTDGEEATRGPDHDQGHTDGASDPRDDFATGGADAGGGDGGGGEGGGRTAAEAEPESSAAAAAAAAADAASIPTTSPAPTSPPTATPLSFSPLPASPPPFYASAASPPTTALGSISLVISGSLRDRGGLPSRGEPTGARAIQGIKGTSKSFTAGRDSPIRQLRSRGSSMLAPVRETPRPLSDHSSRPASSAVAMSSVPPSPDMYGQEPPRPGSGTIGLWPPATGPSAASMPPSLDDVEIRGAALRVRNSSSFLREAAGGSGVGPGHRGSSTALAGLAAASPLMTPPEAVPELSLARVAPTTTPPDASSRNPTPRTPRATAAAPPPPPVEDSSQLMQSNSSVPSLGMGSTVVAVGRNRPLVMPFLERQAAAIAAAAAAATPGPAAAGLQVAAAAAAALAAGPAVGRRPPGPPGAIRLGPAYPQHPLSASGSQSGGPPTHRESYSSIPRAGRDPRKSGASAFETPGPTGDGGQDDVPPLYAVASHEWEKPLPRGGPGAAAAGAGASAGASGYAAGGGAAAVKAAAAAGSASGGKSAVAVNGGKAAAAGGAAPATLVELQLGEVIQIRGFPKAGAAPGQDAPAAVGQAGVPGRRGRRLPCHPSTSNVTAAAMASFFASVEATIAEGDRAADKMLLPSGLARRLKAARLMASGPPPFQRRREPPPPPSPSGIKLDGFMLLEAADEDMPEAVQFATLESRHISAVESADLSYFIALRSLDVSDNKLPSLVCLATLQALVRLRAASCRMTSLGPWPGYPIPNPVSSAGGGNAGGGNPAGGNAAGGTNEQPTKTPSGAVRRHRTRSVMQADSSSTGATDAGEQSRDGGAGTRQGDPIVAALAAGAAAPPPPLGARAEPSSSSMASADTGGGAAATDGTGGAGDGALIASLLAPVNARPFNFLETLDLSFNQLQPHMVLLPGTPLTLLPRLVELDLSSNHFKHLPSPSEIVTAAAKLAAAAAAGNATAAVTGGVSFPALRLLRLADNGLKGSAIASLAALAPPCLTHLDLSHNAISEAPSLKFLTALGHIGLEDSSGSLASSRLAAANAAAVITGAAQPQQQQQGPKARVSGPQLTFSKTDQSQQQQRQQQPPPPQQQPSSSLSLQPSSQQSMLSQSLSPQEHEQQVRQRYGTVLTRLAMLDLTFNKVASEGAVAALTHLPALQRLLLVGNPLVVTASRPSSQRAANDGVASKLDFGEPQAAPARPTVAASLTARFARIPEAGPKQQANTLAAAAAAAITSAAAPERVSEAYDRLDATIEQWRLNTVVEEDEEADEEDGEEEAGDDRTFLTGIGIQERRRKHGTAAPPDGDAAGLDPLEEGAAEEQDAAAAAVSTAPAAAAAEERPIWESITDPTERLAVALGLDPLTLPMHTGVLTMDSAGAIAALRFALAHPLVEANEGLAPQPGYTAATTATQLKRRPRRPAPTQRLAPMGGGGGGGGSGSGSIAAAPAAAASAAAAGPKAAKIQTVEAMLEGMRGKLAALEASLAVQLAAAAPALQSAEGTRKKSDASRRRDGGGGAGGGGDVLGGRRGLDTDSSDDDDDDAGSTGSALPEDVIDQIERESGSEDDEDEQAMEEEMGPSDPKEGITLTADSSVAGTNRPDDGGNAAGYGGRTGTGNGDQPLSPGRGTLASSPPSRVVVTGATSRSASSPRRVNTVASLGTGPSARKGVSIGGAVSVGSLHVSGGTAPLPGVAASALGYS